MPWIIVLFPLNTAEDNPGIQQEAVRTLAYCFTQAFNKVSKTKKWVTPPHTHTNTHTHIHINTQQLSDELHDPVGLSSWSTSVFLSLCMAVISLGKFDS